MLTLSLISLPKEKYCQKKILLLPHLLPPSTLSLYLSLSLSLSSELPAGFELFYAVVVTGRFIRLEICTNQLSFTASCQCVKLSDLLWGGGGEPGGCRAEWSGQPQRKENEFKQTWNGAPFFPLHAPVEPPLIFLDVEQQHAENDMPPPSVHCGLLIVF